MMGKTVLMLGVWGSALGLGGSVAACGSDDDPAAVSSTGGAGGADETVAPGQGGESGADGVAGAGGAEPDPPLDLGLAEPPPTGTFTDARDGREYRWVELDGTRWMAQNLRYQLPEGDLVTCYYDPATSSDQCDLYGYFYGWSAAHAQARVAGHVELELPEGTYQGLCPAGWHLPTRQEWIDLLDYVTELAGLQPPTDILGMLSYSGIAEPFRSTTEWDDSGTNELLFDLKPYTEGFIGSSASFWASDDYGRGSGRIVSFYAEDVYLDVDLKEYRHSIRCVEGEATAEFPTIEFPPPSNTTGTLTDARDGQQYATTQIGAQHWMAENLNYATSGSLCYAHQADHCRLFGSLYDFLLAQTVCPSGWHLPTVEEWQVLADYVDAQTDRAGRTETDNTASWTIGQHLINSVLWQSPPDVDPPFGFNALPGGWMLDSANSGAFPDREAVFWSASGDDEITVTINSTYLSTAPVRSGVQASVRCLED
jgi:uncharacterized protein (TIGR02145 family)